MRIFTVDLRSACSFDDVVVSFNKGLIEPNGGEWNGNSWNAFHDYLSWPEDENYQLKLVGWEDCEALAEEHRAMMESIFKDNPHVVVRFD